MKVFLLLFILHSTFYISNCYPQSGWEIIPSGITTELNSVSFFEYGVGYACGESGIVIKSIDSGKTWQALQTPVTSNLNDIHLFHRDTVEIVGDNGTMLFSTDGGSYWWEGPSFLTENYYCVTFYDGHGICGGGSQTILWGTYSGTSLSWIEIQSGFFGGGFWGAAMLSPQIGFVAGENSIFQPLLGMTTDSGVNWNFHSFYLDGNEGRATGIDFTDMFIGYVSARVWDGRGAIAKTTDSGSNWVTTFFNTPLWDIDFPISNASLLGYAVGDEGVILKTTDAGDDWLQQQSGTNLKLNKVYFEDPDFGFAVGENGIILKTTTGGEPVTHSESYSLNEISFRLEQNYPNPFNPSTKIKFTIPAVETRHASSLQMVTLKVYDVLGNEIATLVNEEKQAGEYEVEFDGTALPSGIYFYQIKAGTHIQTKKMTILK